MITASALLVITGTIASLWTLTALSRLSDSVASIVRGSDRITAATASVATALEREDDAVLLVVAGSAGGSEILLRDRAQTDASVAQLVAIRAADTGAIATSIARYRTAADHGVALSDDHDALLYYHREVNPPLRAAIAAVGVIRDHHFIESQAAATYARDEVRRARTLALVIAIGALVVSVIVALRLARAVIGPLENLRRSAVAIRQGAGGVRADVPAGDEVGDVAAAFNAMATHLDEFRRSNLAEILDAKASLEATLVALPDAVMLIEATGRIAALNGEAEALLRDVGAEAARDLTALAPLGISAAQVAQVIAGNAAPPSLVLDSAVSVQRPGGMRHLLPRILAVGGELRRVVIVISDVTDLVRLDQMRVEMIAVASHELKTPVTTLRMTLLMLREAGIELRPALRELVDTAMIGVGQLTETVEELLDLTRVEAGQLRLNLERLDLARMMEESLPRWQARAADAAARIELVLDGRPTVLADRGRFRIVIDNLIDNAVKYSPRDGVVTIEIVEAPSGVKLAVVDRGPGIPELYASRVFEKFFRIEHHQRRSGDEPHGSGIGLYLCRLLVELHGGRISCVPSERGTRIEIELPGIQTSRQNAAALPSA